MPLRSGSAPADIVAGCSRGGSGVGADLHRAELQRRELVAAGARAASGGRTRARRVALDPQAISANSGAVTSRPSEAPAMSIARLTSRDDAARPHRRQADQRQPLDAVELDLRADGLEQPRHEVDLHVALAEHPDGRASPAWLVGERDDHALDVEALDHLVERSGVPRTLSFSGGRRGAPSGARRRSRRR